MKSERDFWSRRRAAVQAEDVAERQRTDAADIAQAQAELAERPEGEVLEELGLPVPETVCSGDDLKGFMAKSVPEYLRRRALRSLWRSNPVLACLDGLNDYDGDFTNAATDAPGVKTAYQVGKGLKAHLDYLAAADEVKEIDETEPCDVAPEDTAVAVDEAPAPEDAAEAADAEPHDDALDAPRPRRMAFHFASGDAG